MSLHSLVRSFSVFLFHGPAAAVDTASLLPHLPGTPSTPRCLVFFLPPCQPPSWSLAGSSSHPCLLRAGRPPGLRVCTSYQCDPSFSLTHPLWLSLFLCTLAVLLPLEYSSSWTFVRDTCTAHPSPTLVTSSLISY